MKSEMYWPTALAVLPIMIILATAPLASGADGPTPRPTNNKENRLGYAGGTLVLKGGTTTIGKARFWTKRGLQSVTVGYKESPNAFDLPWTEVLIDLVDAPGKPVEIITVKSVEPGKGYNYVSLIVPEKPNEVLWISLAAIETVAITKTPAGPFKSVDTDGDAFGQFRLTLNSATDYGTLDYQANISLLHPLPSGKRSIVGGLVGSFKPLRIYNGTDWKELDWSKVHKLSFSHPKNSPATDESLPSYLYRGPGQHVDSYLEYSIPAEKQ